MSATVTVLDETNVVAENVRPSRKNRNITATVPWTMRRIDALPGGRANFIRVMVPNPKIAGKASANWSLYGALMKPSVTVADFIKSYPIADGGVTRAERSLTWDLDRGFIQIVTFADAAPAVSAPKPAIPPEEADYGNVSVGFGSRLRGGNAG